VHLADHTIATVPEGNRSLLALLFSTLAFRLFCIFWYRTDYDEPQHLHVVWGWARGLVQYRDVFDNHPPLFHLLSIPLLRWSPESADILLRGRFFVLPLALVSLLLTWLIAKRAFNQRVGLVSAILLGVTPPFVLKTVEFRNDVLWCALLLVSVLVLISGCFTVARSMTAGLILGFALTSSLKTAILIIALVLAAVTFWFRDRGATGRNSGNERMALFAGGLTCAVAPLLTALLFGWLGAFDDLVYGAWGFNSLFRVSNVRRIGGLIALPLLAGVTLAVTRRRLRAAGEPTTIPTFLGVTSIYYIIVLLCLWPIITTRDFLPVLPIGVILVSAQFTRGINNRSSRMAPALAGLVLAGMTWTIFYGDLWRPPTDYSYRIIEDVLRLTRLGEVVMDLKGETVFRPRATRYIFEHVGRELVKRGILEDKVVSDIIAKRCCVAVRDHHGFSTNARRFMNENFISVGSVRVCGKQIASLKRGEDATFSIAVPGRYAMTGRGEIRGNLDGTSYTGPRWLDVGKHRFTAQSTTRDLYVVWAQAVERGMLPERRLPLGP